MNIAGRFGGVTIPTGAKLEDSQSGMSWVVAKDITPGIALSPELIDWRDRPVPLSGMKMDPGLVRAMRRFAESRYRGDENRNE